MSEQTILSKALAQPCEKVDVCDWVRPKCREAIPYDPEHMRSIPARRWIDCMGYKATMGLQFVKEFGTWMVKRCPICGADIVEETLKRKRK